MVENQFSYGHIAISPEIEQARHYTQITILSPAGSYQSKKVSLRITGTYKYSTTSRKRSHKQDQHQYLYRKFKIV
jgi:hypothetical protein